MAGIFENMQNQFKEYGGQGTADRINRQENAALGTQAAPVQQQQQVQQGLGQQYSGLRQQDTQNQQFNDIMRRAKQDYAIPMQRRDPYMQKDLQQELNRGGYSPQMIQQFNDVYNPPQPIDQSQQVGYL